MMKRTAKAFLAIILAAIMLASFTVIPAFADETQGKTNYVTEKWVPYFAGTITETEEDGTIVYEYIPEYAYSWFSPTLNVFNDLKTLIGEREGALVNISFEIQAASDKEEQISTTRVMFRAENPKTGNLAYDPGTVGDWDGNGYSWIELYKENFNSDLEFSLEAQNNYAFPEDCNIEINNKEWLYFETGPIYIAKVDLNDTLFSGWLLCFDGLDYNANFMKGLRLRNASIIDCDEKTATEVPADPTEAPTQAPTDEPVNTDAPVEVNTPQATADNSSPATAKTQDETDNKTDGNKSNLGLIIGIIAAVVVVAAVIIAVLVGKKKKGK